MATPKKKKLAPVGQLIEAFRNIRERNSEEGFTSFKMPEMLVAEDEASAISEETLVEIHAVTDIVVEPIEPEPINWKIVINKKLAGKVKDINGGIMPLEILAKIEIEDE